MKKVFTYILFAALTAVFTSCKEDVDVVGEFKETPVLVGILDMSDTIHFIKLQRAFIGPGNALEIAKIPDSNYYSDAEIKIDEVKNNVIVRSWNLYDTLVDNKDPNGVFFAPQQKLYAFKAGGSFGAPLDSTATYRLTASMKGGALVVEGETQLVHSLKTANSNSALKFADDPGEYLSANISFSSGTSEMVNFKTRIIYSEHTATDSVIKSYVQHINELSTQQNGSYAVSFNGQQFYESILANVQPNASVTKRRLVGFEYILVGGSEELVKYIVANEPTSSIAQTKPTYTNLTVTEGHEVVGIFTSRRTYKSYKANYNNNAPALRLIDNRSMRELSTGPITGNLLFCSENILDSSNPGITYCPY